MKKLVCAALLAGLSVGLSCFAADAPAKPSSAEWSRAASEAALAALKAGQAKHEKEIAELRAEMAKVPAATLAPELAAAHQGKDCILFVRPTSMFVNRKVAPSADEVKAEATLTLAGDQTAGIQLGIWALKSLAGVSCKVSDLVSGADKLAAADRIRVYQIANIVWPRIEAKGASVDGDVNTGTVEKGALTEKAVAMFDLPSVDIAADEAAGVWIDVSVPAGTPAGSYAGEIRILAADREVAKRTLSVKVLPFVLDPAGNWGRGAFTSKHSSRECLILDQEHGLNMVSWWTKAGVSLKYRNGKVEGDFQGVLDYLKLLDSLGYVGPHVHFAGGDSPNFQNRIFEFLKRPTISDGRQPDAAAKFRQSDLSEPFGALLCDALRQMHQQFKAAGHGDLPFCLLDEPDHMPRPARLDWYNKMFALVEKGAQEIPLYGTYYHEGDEKKLSQHHAVWTTNCPSPEKYEACKKAGKQLWVYGHMGEWNGDPYRVRFSFGMIPWVYEAQGAFFWANYWNRVSPFDPFDAKAPADFDTWSLHTDKGPLASLMLKNLREAVDDRRYIATLEVRIAMAKKAGGEAAKRAEADEAFLNSFRLPLRAKMVVRGLRPDLSAVKLEIAGTNGRKGVLSGSPNETRAFAEFVRAEVVDRILAYGEMK